MSRKQSPLFLERRSYRLRRLMDGARLMPFLGAALWAVPMLWTREGEAAISTSRAMLYIFLVWFCLSCLAGILSIWLNGNAETESLAPKGDR
ncbi:hypothetical protein [Thalassobius sp. MITS945101]|uniref:hypothetical protein n=1 Tax=Thalassobius sp. MITS945101 TaxID=3096994 RepID=UPI00399A7338